MIYIALLRGINVGGNHMIKMADLKSLLETFGLKRVQTYINSGNILFDTDEKAGKEAGQEAGQEADELRKRIEQEIEVGFGFPAPVVLRTAAEWAQIVEQCPFRADELQSGESIHLSLLLQPPAPSEKAAILSLQGYSDEFLIKDQEIYFYFRQSILDSKLLINLQKLKIPMTMRNWKTVIKLAQLSQTTSF